VLRLLVRLHAADVADSAAGLRRRGQGAVGGGQGVVGIGIGVCWSQSRRAGGVGDRVRRVRGLVVGVLVCRLLALLVLAVAVVGAVVVVVRTRVRLFFFVFDFYGYYDGLFEGHVRVLWCGCGGWGSLRGNGSLRVLDCCWLSMLRGLLVLYGHDCC
jgi:hypothetical protein